MLDTLTPQQEGFTLDISKGDSSQAACYRNNYDCTNMSDNAVYVEASRLMDNPKIALRLSEHKLAVQSQVIHTQASLAAEALINLQMSRELKQMGPANKAIELVARLTGNLDAVPAETVIQITKVTVVLPSNTPDAKIVDVESYQVSTDPEEETKQP